MISLMLQGFWHSHGLSPMYGFISSNSSTRSQMSFQDPVARCFGEPAACGDHVREWACLVCVTIASLAMRRDIALSPICGYAPFRQPPS